MQRAGDLFFLIWAYLLVSLAVSLLAALLLCPTTVERHSQGAALLYYLFGPTWALGEAERAFEPVGATLLVFALASPIILPLLAAPLGIPERTGVRLRSLGLLLWLLLAAGFLAAPLVLALSDVLLAEALG